MTKTIQLTHNKGNVLVDDEDFDRLITHKWCNSHGYAVTGIRTGKETKILRMHRLIAQTPDRMQTDHINGNTLDNRKCNLRICTNSTNQRNRRATNNSSSFKGVSWNKERKKWEAYIKVDGRQIHLGKFPSEKAAARRYDQAALEHFGEFARLNFGGNR